jgi:hypothetical protein
VHRGDEDPVASDEAEDEMTDRPISTIDNPGNSDRMLWIRDHMGYTNAYCCLIWPYSRLRQGYAAINRNDKQVYVHRFMCELRHGPPPTAKHQASHSCNRGADGCVNPLHLSWKTPGENQLDRVDGSGRPQRKLTIEQVDQIRELKGREHIPDTARRFNTSETNIRRIQSGQTWKKDRTDIKIFSDDEIRAIRASPKTHREIAAEFKAGRRQIETIRQRLYYKHVSDLEDTEHAQ